MVLSPPGVVIVVLIESVLASVRVHSSVEFMVLDSPPMSNVREVAILRVLPSANHVAVDLLSPRPVELTLSLPSRVYLEVIVNDLQDRS